MLHNVVAAQQSSAGRVAAVIVVVAVAGLYLWIREQRGKKRRSHRP